MVITLIVFVVLIVGVTVWVSRNAQPRENRGDSSVPYSGDTSPSGHIHSDHCGHGHDAGASSGGDCGGGDGGGGSD